MDISCDIIRDLLPLYAEDLASEDTRNLVDEHLCDCEDCTKVLNGMKKSTPAFVETAAESLNKVKKIIRRRRLVSVLAAVMTVVTVASAVMTYLFTPFQLTMEQALDDFYIREDGAVVVDYSPYVSGRLMAGDENNWYISQYSNRYEMWKRDHRKSIEETYGSGHVIVEEERLCYEGIDIYYGRWETPDGSIQSDSDIPWRDDDRVVEWESEKNWWYADPIGLGNHIQLHDAGKPAPEEYNLFSPVYPAIFYGGIGLALMLFFLRKFLKKNWMGELFVRLSILSTGAVVSTLLVSSGRILTSTVGVIDQYWSWMIPMNTVCFALTILFWRQLYLMNKGDRGI